MNNLLAESILSNPDNFDNDLIRGKSQHVKQRDVIK